MRWQDSRLYEAVADPPAAPPAVAPAADPKDAEIARLQAALRQPAPPAAPPIDKKALEVEFFKNPLEMSTAIANAAALNNPANDTMIEVAMSQARGSDPEMQAVWDKYLPEIQQHVGTVQPQFRTNVTVWRNAFNFVRGQRMEEIFTARKAATPAIHTSDGPAAPGVRAAGAPPKSKLTEEESYIATQLGLSEDSYRHGKEIMAGQHGKEKSPWDDVVTIDSQAQRRSARDAKRKSAA